MTANTQDSEPPRRLFVALWPDEAVRRALQARRDAVPWPAGARRTADDKLHLTLHFLGNVAASRLPALVDTLAAVPCPRFELRLTRVRTWPRGLVVLEGDPACTCGPLSELHRRLGAALRAFGLPPDKRAFRPHVTLARDCPAGTPARHAMPETLQLAWPVAAHTLVHSTPDGRYRVLAQFGGDGESG